MADPYFELVTQGVALYALSTRAEAGVAGYWAGFRPPAGFSLTPALSLDHAWLTADAVYLFSARPVTDAAAFAARLDAWLAVHAPARDIRLLWLDDPDRPDTWHVAPLRARQVTKAPPVWEITHESRFVLGGYRVTVPVGARIEQRVAGASTGLWLLDQRLTFTTPAGDTFPGRFNMARIPFVGSGLGGWTALLEAGGANPSPAKFNPQLRYATSTATVSMPLLREDRTTLNCELTFDPLHPALPARTAIALWPAAGGTAPALASTLRTPLGRHLTLAPQGTQSPWPARLVFNRGPAADGDGHYLTADGAFDAGGADGDPRLALGLSGVEYVELPAGAAVCRFVAGRPAFVDGGKLTGTATTAYLDPLPAGRDSPGLTYFAQPDGAPWFAVSDDAFLAGQPLPAATLPGWAAGGGGLPFGCYSAVAATDSAAAAELEAAVLAPNRRDLITGTPPPAGSAVHCVTPQGISARLAAGRTGWDSLTVAAFPDAAVPDLTFTDVSATLRGHLQASELFMVVADLDVFGPHASVRYRVDAVVLDLLRSDDVPEPVIARIAQQTGNQVFNDEQSLVAALAGVETGYVDLVLRYAGLFKVAMDGWTFQLSPHSWRTREAPTMMVVKLAGRSFAELAADPAAWTWQRVAGDADETSERLTAIVEAAGAAPPDSGEGRFYRTVLADPRWTGVLFLNAPITAAELPDDMRFVTAGIDPRRFFAHHVAFSYTPFTVSRGRLDLGNSAASALIRYADDTELAPTTTVAFQFVTQRLEARFAGGALADLSTQVQLIVNELFGSRLTRVDPVGGNSLTIVGTYQRQGDVAGYRFNLARPAAYLSDPPAALDSIEVLGVAVRTVHAAGEQPAVTVEFALDGNLRFAQLPGFDLYSYGQQQVVPPGARAEDGYLRFADLVVTMRFPVTDPGLQTFTSDEGRLRVDPAASRARRGSLVAGFPVIVTGLVAVPAGDTRPADLGFAPVLAPMDQVPLTPPWFGLTLRVDLGSLGQLADASGLTATVLAGWMPRTDGGGPAVFCGLKVPGPDDGGWPVQGVLRLGFRGFEFVVDRSGVAPAYLLVLRRLALSVLGWSFPPRQADVIVFGDPAASDAAVVGWYAAYPREIQ